MMKTKMVVKWFLCASLCVWGISVGELNAEEKFPVGEEMLGEESPALEWDLPEFVKDFIRANPSAEDVTREEIEELMEKFESSVKPNLIKLPIKPVANLDMTAFAGNWFQVAASTSTVLLKQAQCQCSAIDLDLQSPNTNTHFYIADDFCLQEYGFLVDISKWLPTTGAELEDPSVVTPQGKFAKSLSLIYTDSDPRFWVVYVNSTYDVAVLAGPNAALSPVFVYSRSVNIDPLELATALVAAAAAGVPKVKLIPPFLKYTPCQLPPV